LACSEVVDRAGANGHLRQQTHGALTAFQKNRCEAVDGDVDPVYKYIAGFGGDPVSP
jgi:hypothetical protein